MSFTKLMILIGLLSCSLSAKAMTQMDLEVLKSLITEKSAVTRAELLKKGHGACITEIKKVTDKDGNFYIGVNYRFMNQLNKEQVTTTIVHSSEANEYAGAIEQKIIEHLSDLRCEGVSFHTQDLNAAAATELPAYRGSGAPSFIIR